MKEQRYLGELELMLLLAIGQLGDRAYGVPLAKELTARRGREVSLGSVYAALDRLELKKMVSSRLGESTPERGGRAKRYFNLTEPGRRAMSETWRVLNEMWRPEWKEGRA